MSPSFNIAESQWLAQLAAMREAIAELKLDQPLGELPKYGQDIVMNDEDPSGGSLDGIWDVFGDDEVDGSISSYSDEIEQAVNGDVYDLEWLRDKCMDITDRQGSDLESGHLQDHVYQLLLSNIGSTSLGIFTDHHDY